MNGQYKQEFYVNRHQKTVYSAKSVLSLVLKVLPPVHSAIDFGCGVGTWLSVLKEEGVTEIRGLDGPWVDQNLLEIDKKYFIKSNFEEPIFLDKRYDLAISLEVAEHVSKNSASIFVESLVGASDFVLFAAAIPFQGGTGHINEQWPDYWIEQFSSKDYVALDYVRSNIWNDNNIPFWYRQNIFLFVKRERVSSCSLDNINQQKIIPPISLVHPDLYLSKNSHMPSVRESYNLFFRSLKHWVMKKI